MTRNELNAITDVTEMISTLKMAGWSAEYHGARPYPWRVNHPDGEDYELGENLLDAWSSAWRVYVDKITGD